MQMNKQTTIDFFNSFLAPDEKITIRFLKDRDKSGTNEDATSGKYGTIQDLLPLIAKQNAKTWGAYFVVNQTGSAKTKDENVQHARALFIDIDSDKCPEYFPVQPSCILKRSDGIGYHVYWFLSAPEKDLEKWTAAQKALIHFYKSDKVIHNPARIMRIPGTVNHKETCKSPTYEIMSGNKKRYPVSEVLTGHTREDKRREQARRRIAGIFKGSELSDGDGRHKAFVSVAFILNDYGFTGQEAREELTRANEKYLQSTYSKEELDKFLDSQKYAKGEKGGASAAKILQEQAQIEYMKDAIKEWYYVRQQDSFFQEGSSLPVTSTGFNAKFSYAANKTNPAHFCFLHDCIKQYESLVYDPSQDTDITIKGGINRNMYQGPELSPIEKKPEWFLKHIDYLMQDKTEREHFLNYLAYLIQNPGDKVLHGMLIIGRQGIGKSIMQRVFSKVFGADNVCAPHNENLCGNFTGWAKHCQIVVINELMQIDKKDFNNKIKPFITEPEIEIREMYKAPYTIKNCMNIIAFSNHDNAVYIDKDDRRWFIVKSNAEKNAPAYYDQLLDDIENRSGEVLHFLQTRDIKDFRPGANPPMTEAKRDIIEYSTPDLDAWVKEQIESGASPCESDIITIEDLRSALPRQLQNGYATQNRIGKILRDCGGQPLKDRHRVGGGLKRFWVIRNHANYVTGAQIKAKIGEIYGKIDSEKNENFLQ
jgi:hypothetical protein